MLIHDSPLAWRIKMWWSIKSELGGLLSSVSEQKQSRLRFLSLSNFLGSFRNSFQSMLMFDILLVILNSNWASVWFPGTWGQIWIWLWMWCRLSKTEGICMYMSYLGFGSGCAPERCLWVITALGDRVKLWECCRASRDPSFLIEGWALGVAWDPFNVQSVSRLSGCLLKVLQVVDDPRDGLLSCGAHCTLCEEKTGKHKCEGANMFRLCVWGKRQRFLSFCSLEKTIFMKQMVQVSTSDKMSHIQSFSKLHICHCNSSRQY